MSKNQSHERKYFGFIIEGGFLWESNRDINKGSKRGGRVWLFQFVAVCS